MAQGFMSGTRLEYVVVPIEGVVKRKVYQMIPRGQRMTPAGRVATTHERKEILREEPGGFMVYFPRGHCIRFKDKKALEQYGLNKPPKIINMQGLADPNSPLGQLMTAQDDAGRAEAMASLQQKVISMATALTGVNLVTRNEELAA